MTLHYPLIGAAKIDASCFKAWILTLDFRFIGDPNAAKLGGTTPIASGIGSVIKYLSD